MAVNEQRPETDAEKAGIGDTVKLSFCAIDQSNLPFDKKRNLLFSVYSFRCLFDNAEMQYINPVLTKYVCTFSCALNEHPFYQGNEAEFKRFEQEKTTYLPYGGLYIKDGDTFKVRFDAGSPVWQEFKKRGKLPSPADTVPEKFSLYETAYEIVNLDTADTQLRAMWYLTFPYAMLLGAPHDPELYEILLETLSAKEVLGAVLNSPYSLYVRDSEQELAALELPSPVVNWYLPYLAYKSFRDENGVSREEKRFQRWLAAGRFIDVLRGTEKLLDTFPDDDGILLCNIAARVSLENAAGDETRTALLKETLALAESALERGPAKKIFFLYYAGLAHLGLKNTESALANFFACTELNPDFAPAKVMVKALEEKLKSDN